VAARSADVADDRRSWVLAVLAGEARPFAAWVAAGRPAAPGTPVAAPEPPPTAAALELVRRLNAALPPDGDELLATLRRDVVADVLRAAPGDPDADPTAAPDEVDASLVGELLAGVLTRTLALEDEARAALRPPTTWGSGAA